MTNTTNTTSIFNKSPYIATKGIRGIIKPFVRYIYTI